MTRPLPDRSLARVFASDARIAVWTARQQHEAALTRVVRGHLPHAIAERVCVSDARGGVLELAAGGGAIAATLRQRTPQLRESLAKAGFDFHELRVRVQVAGTRYMEPDPPGRHRDTADAAPLFALASRLPEGPLRAAIARWSRRARGR